MGLKYGIIGTGMMGQEHIRNINLVGGAQVAAVADPDATMRAQAAALAGTAPTQFADHRDMLAQSDLDALVIVSPNDTHRDIMFDALQTDIPILCEKPLCTTVADCSAVLARANGRAAPVWVAMEYRYMPPVARLLSELQAGTAGTPRMMAMREHRFPFLSKVGGWNRFQNRTGGTLVEKCCHFFDLMRLALQSDPVRVFASGGIDENFLDELHDGKRPDIIDNAFVIVDFESGARAMLDLCMFAEGSYWQEVVSVTGAKARIDAKVPGPARFSPDGKERHSEVQISYRDTKQVATHQIEVDHAVLQAGDHHGSTFYQHQKFRDLVATGKGQPEVTLTDGLWSVAVGEAAEKSVRSGEAVALSNPLAHAHVA